jgi:hypothetical protein
VFFHRLEQFKPHLFTDAALRIKVPVICLDGEKVLVTVPPGTQHGTALRVRGKKTPRLRAKNRGVLVALVKRRAERLDTSNGPGEFGKAAGRQKSLVLNPVIGKFVGAVTGSSAALVPQRHFWGGSL